MPSWLIAVFVIIGVIGGLAGLILLIRAFNKRKTTKFKIPTTETETQKPEIQGEEYVEPDEFENVNFDEPQPNDAVKPQIEPFNPFDFDEDFSDEDERRYREFVQGSGRRRREKRQLSPEEEFEKFRQEHCYSKFVTDSELAAALKNAPREVRDVILNDLLKSLDLSKYDTKI